MYDICLLGIDCSCPVEPCVLQVGIRGGKIRAIIEHNLKPTETNIAPNFVSLPIRLYTYISLLWEGGCVQNVHTTGHSLYVMEAKKNLIPSVLKKIRN
jgi:hypothetical protein